MKGFFNKIFKEKSDLSKFIENKDNIIKLKDKQIAELKNESFIVYFECRRHVFDFCRFLHHGKAKTIN